MKPPKKLYQFLTWCCPKDRIDILGDFEEWYQELVEEKGKKRSTLILFFHGLTMLRLKAISKTQTKTQFIMTGLHLKIARRNLSKNKLYTIINLLGLSFGISICLLIGLFIQNELSYDTHFEGYEDVYRIAGSYNQGGDDKTVSTYLPYLLQPTMQNNLDPVVTYTRMDLMQLYVQVGEQNFWEDYSIAVDSNFFEVFKTKFVSGDPSNVLDDPSSIVLDQSTATKYFEDKEAIDQSLELEGKTFIVKGIIEDLPNNTHFAGNLFIPIAGIVDTYPYWMTNTYGGVSHRMYFRVPEGYNVNILERSLNELVAEYVSADDRPEYFFQRLKDIHLTSDLVGEIRQNGSYRTIYIFLATAIVILLLACINFINLSIAGSLERLKEIGVKKVMGASRKSQIWQFQMEALIVGGAASFFAVLLVELFLPLFNQVTDRTLELTMMHDVMIFVFGLGLISIISLISGSFPAHFLLKVPTSNALSGLIQSKKRSTFNPRKVLVGIQFFLAAILISSTLVILNQLHFMQNKDLGIDTDQLIIASLQTSEGVENYPLLKEELLKESSIRSVTASNARLAARVGGWRQYRKPNTAENVLVPTVIVAHDYFETVDAEFVDGRGFSEDFNSDYREAYIVNEEGAKFLELSNAVGENLIGSAFTGQDWSTKDAKIIGVVKDFHFASLHNKIRPVVFSLNSEITTPLRWVYIKISPEDIQKSLETIESSWSKINSDIPFRYRFVDDYMDEHYQQDARFLQVFSAFAIISIFIGCLGLFGLTAFIMRKRTKEIGIRKVLGASQLGLLKVLSLDFMKLVAIASVLGIPITIYLMTEWLENFEYRISIDWWVFGLTSLGALIAGGISIFYHSMKVANANPVESIKYE